MKIDKIWLCESVVKLKRIRKQREAKIDYMDIHTINALQSYGWSYGLTKLQIWGFGRIYEHGLEVFTWKTNALHQRPQESEKYLFLEI